MMENLNEFEEERFEKGMRDLRRLNEVLERVYFGDIEYYLEEMSKESRDSEWLGKESHNYKESLDSFRNFKPIFQRLALALRKLPNFR